MIHYISAAVAAFLIVVLVVLYYCPAFTADKHDFIGLVLSYDEGQQLAWIEQRNNFKVGDDVEFLQPQGALVQHRISRMTCS